MGSKPFWLPGTLQVGAGLSRVRGSLAWQQSCDSKVIMEDRSYEKAKHEVRQYWRKKTVREGDPVGSDSERSNFLTQTFLIGDRWWECFCQCWLKVSPGITRMTFPIFLLNESEVVQFIRETVVEGSIFLWDGMNSMKAPSWSWSCVLIWVKDSFFQSTLYVLMSRFYKFEFGLIKYQSQTGCTANIWRRRIPQLLAQYLLLFIWTGRADTFNPDMAINKSGSLPILHIKFNFLLLLNLCKQLFYVSCGPEGAFPDDVIKLSLGLETTNLWQQACFTNRGCYRVARTKGQHTSATCDMYIRVSASLLSNIVFQSWGPNCHPLYKNAVLNYWSTPWKMV